jgi:hypothetical protein
MVPDGGASCSPSRGRAPEAAGGIYDATRNAVVRRTFRITATDNYVVVLSTGEVSPDFGDGPARFVCERDGKPLDTPRLVTPGDKHGTRDARDVVTITVE